MTRMFPEITKTWSPAVGCLHGCVYCFARDLALGRLKHLPRYKEGFNPSFIPGQLKRRFHDVLVFVSDMGDLWGRWVTREQIIAVLEAIRCSPDAVFLFLTKNPGRYHQFLDLMPANVILGATTESNQYRPWISEAGCPEWRAWAMASIPNSFRKMISIEPIMDFDLGVFANQVKEIEPSFVYIGYDNHSKHLPEPPLEKTRELIAALGEFTEVRTKTLRETEV